MQRANQAIEKTMRTVDFGQTPARGFSVPVGSRRLNLILKLEGANRFGSIKSRTASALIDDLESTGQLRTGGRIVESTSGNLGIALAGICAERGYDCTLVVDSNVPDFSAAQMQEYGARLIRIQKTNLRSPVEERLKMVADILATDRGMLWTNQYGSQAAPRVHGRTTAPELLSAFGSRNADALFVPVSTGGTLAGISRFARRFSPDTMIVAVDAVGSAALGGPLGKRPEKLAGFGSDRHSQFDTDRLYDMVSYVSDREAASACRVVHARTGLQLGGSAGAAVAAALVFAERYPSLRNVACLCPDGGDRYATKIYAAHEPTEPSAALALLAAIQREPELDTDGPGA
jgi:N-(2-amino-2-carboxyethyl)-L-glutamate synthase